MESSRDKSTVTMTSFFSNDKFQSSIYSQELNRTDNNMESSGDDLDEEIIRDMQADIEEEEDERIRTPPPSGLSFIESSFRKLFSVFTQILR